MRSKINVLLILCLASQSFATKKMGLFKIFSAIIGKKKEKATLLPPPVSPKKQKPVEEKLLTEQAVSELEAYEDGEWVSKSEGSLKRVSTISEGESVDEINKHSQSQKIYIKKSKFDKSIPKGDFLGKFTEEDKKQFDQDLDKTIEEIKKALKNNGKQ